MRLFTGRAGEIGPAVVDGLRHPHRVRRWSGSEALAPAVASVVDRRAGVGMIWRRHAARAAPRDRARGSPAGAGSVPLTARGTRSAETLGGWCRRPGAAQREDHVAIGRDAEPVPCDGRAQRGATLPRQSIALPGGDAHAGEQVDALPPFRTGIRLGELDAAGVWPNCRGRARSASLATTNPWTDAAARVAGSGEAIATGFASSSVVSRSTPRAVSSRRTAGTTEAGCRRHPPWKGRARRGSTDGHPDRERKRHRTSAWTLTLRLSSPPKRCMTATPPLRASRRARSKAHVRRCRSTARMRAGRSHDTDRGACQVVAHPMWQAEHPLPHGHVGQHVIHQVRGTFGHAQAAATRAEPAPPSTRRRRDDRHVTRHSGSTRSHRRATHSAGTPGTADRRIGAIPRRREGAPTPAECLEMIADDGVERARARVARCVGGHVHPTDVR